MLCIKWEVENELVASYVRIGDSRDHTITYITIIEQKKCLI